MNNRHSIFNKKIVINAVLIVLFFLLAASAVFGADAQARLKRYGLLIGANNGGRDRTSLLYAESDTRSIAQVLYEVGGLRQSDSILRFDPSRKDVLQDFRRIRDMIASGRQKDTRAEFFLYYSGHSDEEGLLLGNDRLTYKDLRNEMMALNADVGIAILDSCASGAFIRLKGGTRVSPFLIDESSEMKGQVYLTSSSADEASQESDEIGASYFTHALVSGLRGAADVSQDGRVTIHEAYQYARSETMVRTENTMAGPQHPSWLIELTGTGDLVLTDIKELTAGIILARELEGQIFIKDANSKLIAEINKSAGLPVTIALPAGIYNISVRNAQGSLDASVALSTGVTAALAIGDFRINPSVATTSRGGNVPKASVPNPEGSSFADELEAYVDERIQQAFGGDEVPDPDFDIPVPGRIIDTPAENREPEAPAVGMMPFSFSIVPGLAFPAPAARTYVGFSLNLLLGVNYGIRGAEFGSLINITEKDVFGGQFAGVANIVGDSLTGFQGAGVFNILDGGMKGFQSAGVFNITGGGSSGADNGWFQGAGVFNINSGAFRGGQFAGVFNITSKMQGIQAAGSFNYAKDMKGAQFGVVNVGETLDGGQFGVVNIGKDVKGVQIGVVNIAETMNGLNLGLVNISKNGLMTLSFTGGLSGLYELDFQSGKTLYTLLSAGLKPGSPNDNPVMSSAAGLGLHFPIGPFYLEADAAAKNIFNVYGNPETGYLNALPFPNFRAKAGVVLFNRIGAFAGINAALHVEGMYLNEYAHTGPSYSFPAGGLDWTMYHDFIWGVVFKF
ncbi:MAG: caspase family protein [Spirochaetales bacterium]|nr:MAG: caspase family protein [Spirochaetales bacterium]